MARTGDHPPVTKIFHPYGGLQKNDGDAALDSHKRCEGCLRHSGRGSEEGRTTLQPSGGASQRRAAAGAQPHPQLADSLLPVALQLGRMQQQRGLSTVRHNVCNLRARQGGLWC